MPRCTPGRPETNYVGGLIDLIEVARPSSVLEIGAAAGVSTECFLLTCAHVAVVDPWEGPWAPQYAKFVKRTEMYPNLFAVRNASPAALQLFGDRSFDMVYIDAEHDEESVSRDIRASLRVARRWIAGHDYIREGVRSAIWKILAPKQVRVFSDTSWLVQKERT